MDGWRLDHDALLISPLRAYAEKLSFVSLKTYRDFEEEPRRQNCCALNCLVAQKICRK